MTFVELAPADADVLRRHGLETLGAFHAWRGVPIGGHGLRRYVEAVEVAGRRFFLKKEYVVPWRDRWKNAWAGLGWVSKSVGEANLLRQARQAGVGCPEVVAVGEERGRAFLLLRAETRGVDLRTLLASPLTAPQRRTLAHDLGTAVAALHRAGFDHPDLYAKHILARREGAGWHFCFLDWQRSRRYRHVSWRRRFRDLGPLDASLADALASPRLRLACLRAYLAAAPAPPLGRAARAVARVSSRLLQRRKVRALRQAHERRAAP